MKTMNPFFHLFCLVNLIASSPSFSFTLSSSDITGGWDRKELSFQVNETSCSSLGISVSVLNSAIDTAIDLWNSATTSGLKLKRSGVTTATGLTDPPTIYCTNTIPSPSIVAGQGAESLTAGRPTSGFLRLNGDSTAAPYFGNLDTAYQTIILAHEMGHVLGLGHSQKQYALMYYDISTKLNLNLSQDDIDGITWLNPSNEPATGVMGCGTTFDINQKPPPPPPPGGPNTSILMTWIGLIVIAYGASRPRRISR